LFWDEKRLWLGSGGLKCENSVPKFEREFHPDHWGGPIDPKLCGPSSYVHQTWSASKKSHFRTFAPSTPSGKIRISTHAFINMPIGTMYVCKHSLIMYVYRVDKNHAFVRIYSV